MEKLIDQCIKLLSCIHKIHPHSSPPIRLHQPIRSNITLEDGSEVEADFLAVEGTATPLLGKATAESLGFLKVGVCYVTLMMMKWSGGFLNCGSCLKGV